MKPKLLITYLFSFSLLVGNATLAAEAKLLTKNFYKISDICADAKKRNPSVKAALILLKTHNCDTTSNACIDGLRTLVDESNLFVRKNFVTYQTRFTTFSISQSSPEIKTMNWLSFDGERTIRTEWGKQDSNPEVAVS